MKFFITTRYSDGETYSYFISSPSQFKVNLTNAKQRNCRILFEKDLNDECSLSIHGECIIFVPLDKEAKIKSKSFGNQTRKVGECMAHPRKNRPRKGRRKIGSKKRRARNKGKK